MSFINLFTDFHSRAIAEAYPASVRTLYDTLLHEFNKAYWTPELIYSERELSEMTCLSPATIHRSIKFLTDRAMLKTWRKRNKTIFKLLGENVPNQSRSTSEANLKQTRSKTEAVGLVPYTRDAHEDSRQKTEDKEKEEARAHAKITKKEVKQNEESYQYKQPDYSNYADRPWENY